MTDAKRPMPATSKAKVITVPIKLPLFYLLSDGASLQQGPNGRIIRVPPKAKP